MPALVVREYVGRDLVAASVPDAQRRVHPDLHAQGVCHTSGKYWTSRMPGLYVGVSPGLIE